MALYLIGFVVVLAYIWFNTKAFEEYSSILNFKLFYMDDYKVTKKKFPNTDLKYQDYLLFKHNNFFTRLVSCPICLIPWLSLVTSILFWQNVKTLGVIILGSWLAYFWTVKKIKEWNE